MIRIILNFFLLLLLQNIDISSSQCAAKTEECNEDCDCCGFGNDPGVRCEIRKYELGRRCYVSGHHGRPCVDGNDCKSQYCNPTTGRCAILPRVLPGTPFCPLTFLDSTHAIDGLYPTFPASCSNICSVYSSVGDVSSAFDGDLSTVYSNDRAIDSGILLYPDNNLPVRLFEICSAIDCPECDPTSYRLEGFCTVENDYEFIQEEGLAFSSRNECISRKVRPRKLFSHYRLTFLSQAAPPPECPVEIPGDCSTCPTGLTPYLPPPPGDCAGATQITDGAKLEFVGKTKVGQYTEIVYEISNPGGRRDPYQFDYAVLQWGSEGCCFDCYQVYMDDVTEGVGIGYLSDNDLLNEQTCSSTSDLQKLLLTSDDPNLCMQGLKLIDPSVSESQTYFFKLKIYGDVVMSNQPYGIHYRRRRGSAGIYHGTIMSPICGCQSDYNGECLAYPLQIAEVTLSGKCNQMIS